MFGSYTVRKVLALFPQKLVTSGGSEMQEKDELYRRPGALVSNQNLDFIDQVPNGVNHTDYPSRRAAWVSI